MVLRPETKCLGEDENGTMGTQYCANTMMQPTTLMAKLANRLRPMLSAQLKKTTSAANQRAGAGDCLTVLAM